jgi:hypothetical protein
MELSMSAGEKTGTPRRAQVARMESLPGSSRPRNSNSSREEYPRGGRRSTSVPIARSVSSNFSSST